MTLRERIVRPYEPSDQDQVEWLYARTPPAGQVASRPSRLPDDLKNIDSYFARLWVVVERASPGDRHRGLNDAIVGMAGVQDVARDSIEPALAPFIKTERTMRLHRVSVAPERWRQGIGRQLVQTALEWSRLNEYASLVLETTPQQEAAVALYQALGFEEIGRTRFGVWDLVWFELRLT